MSMSCLWKPNWEVTKKHFRKWWKQEGLLLGAWGFVPVQNSPHDNSADPGEASSIEEQYTDTEWRAKKNQYQLSQSDFPLDILPRATSIIGPGSLALFLGSPAGISKDTVWFDPILKDEPEPEKSPMLKLDKENKWFKITMDTIAANIANGKNNYMAGCPDLVENIDILSSLRDSQTLLMDMIERPDWVKEKLAEINNAWFEVYDIIYEMIKLVDGSSCFDAFALWGDGKTAKVQCDASAMFSTDMFRTFVSPALSAQCEWLDHSMFHLDGSQCIPHLDALLEIEALDAIEWTPDPNVPKGGDPHWYGMYKRILAAGKSVQAIGVEPHEIEPLLDEVGANGLYIMTNINNASEAECLQSLAQKYDTNY